MSARFGRRPRPSCLFSDPTHPILLATKKKRTPEREKPGVLFLSSPPEKDFLQIDTTFAYGCPTTFKLCTPEKIETPVLTDCGTHHVRRTKSYWLRCMRRASTSNRTGPTCIAA